MSQLHEKDPANKLHEAILEFTEKVQGLNAEIEIETYSAHVASETNEYDSNGDTVKVTMEGQWVRLGFKIKCPFPKTVHQ